VSGNTFGVVFRVTTWGESHGLAVGAVVDGCPAGLPLAADVVQRELDRRRPGRSDFASPRGEADEVQLLSGVFEGHTLGTPISMLVWNRDVDSSPYEKRRHLPRPGHADLAYLQRYGRRDHRGGGRSSARESVGRVAAGAVAKALLCGPDVEVLGHVVELGGVRAPQAGFDDIKENAEKNPLRCTDPDTAGEMERALISAMESGDSIGGIVEVVAAGVPPGLGEPVFSKLDADLSSALMGIGAVKGVEIGSGFAAAGMMGSKHNDPLVEGEPWPRYASNRAGGVIGGISTGEELRLRVAVKPTPSISMPQKTVDLESGKPSEIKVGGRHDPAIPPRLVPVAEAMVAIVLADHCLRGGFIHPTRFGSF